MKLSEINVGIETYCYQTPRTRYHGSRLHRAVVIDARRGWWHDHYENDEGGVNHEFTFEPLRTDPERGWADQSQRILVAMQNVDGTWTPEAISQQSIRRMNPDLERTIDARLAKHREQTEKQENAQGRWLAFRNDLEQLFDIDLSETEITVHNYSDPLTVSMDGLEFIRLLQHVLNRALDHA